MEESSGTGSSLYLFDLNGLFHRAGEGSRVDRGEAVEMGLDLLESLAELSPVDHPTVDHLARVVAVLGMPALDFRQGLGVEIVVIEGEPPLLRDEGAAVSPVGELGNELVRGGQLDVDLELVLEAGKGTKEPVGLGLHLDVDDVDVDRARTPTEEDGRGTAREVKADVPLRLPAELAHEAADSRRVYRPPHSAAFSKLTSRRTRALYREWAESGSVSASFS